MAGSQRSSKFALVRAGQIHDWQGAATLRIDCSYLAGKRLRKYQKTVDVPVPAGMERDVVHVVSLLH